MSFKTCFSRLLPVAVKILKHESKILQNHSVQFSSLTRIPQNFSVKYLRHATTVATPNEENHTKQVYYGVLTPQIRAVKLFSLSSSIVGIIAQPFLYTEIASTGNIPIIVAAYSFIGFFTLVTPVLLHFITKKYITHLDFNEKEDTYIAKTVNFLCMTKKTPFKVEDVIVPDVPGMFTTFLVKKTPLFIDPRLFDNPDHYAKIMGYDKPIDFKMHETPPDSGKRN